MRVNVQGFVVGIGSEWAFPAGLAATRLESALKLPFAVMTARPPGMPAEWHPSWAKLWGFEAFPEATHILAADADLLPIAPRASLPIVDFAAALDDDNRPVRHESAAYGIPAGHYFNAGLFLASRAMQPALEAARARGPRYGSWLEQTALNVSVLAHVRANPELQTATLPRALNWLCPPGVCARRAAREGAGIVHLCARRGNAATLAREIETLAAELKV